MDPRYLLTLLLLAFGGIAAAPNCAFQRKPPAGAGVCAELARQAAIVSRASNELR
jgi:hypothetical protein